MGLVKAATPVRIRLKMHAKPPRKPQYPLNPEAEAGIEVFISGLVSAGVQTPTSSFCNTPILPVLKADKKKWWLVHDLRAVNEVVEDFASEVPNPHTLLSNIPPDAKFFSVINLCST